MHSTAEFEDVLAAGKLPTSTTAAQLEGIAERWNRDFEFICRSFEGEQNHLVSAVVPVAEGGSPSLNNNPGTASHSPHLLLTIRAGSSMNGALNDVSSVHSSPLVFYNR
jgi:hypothetical protein